jgi:hypothetical protein
LERKKKGKKEEKRRRLEKRKRGRKDTDMGMGGVTGERQEQNM